MSQPPRTRRKTAPAKLLAAAGAAAFLGWMAVVIVAIARTPEAGADSFESLAAVVDRSFHSDDIGGLERYVHGDGAGEYTSSLEDKLADAGFDAVRVTPDASRHVRTITLTATRRGHLVSCVSWETVQDEGRWFLDPVAPLLTDGCRTS
ncbi:hypothetical protein I5Q34_19350 [Streptomyces sp. AV19]|uniref:hypothetical protein n=1 Tax=Streptomyces sp. AV19 TaxID=2793068 RepID=UPI0018FE8311|nr:hypothetical protein [Streptomyces sp. AV19]MBH1936405.1 hypothetical protein [Streptomyces sp. AV19]MDG4532444.1 hypothetical protein [Streptomyces sp. AV19]